MPATALHHFLFLVRMVRIVDIGLLDFLSFDDLLTYLTDKKIYELDTENISISQEERLLQLIVSLTYEQKLNPVIFYDGLIDIGKYKESEYGLISEGTQKTAHFKGYLLVSQLINSTLHLDKEWQFEGFFQHYKIISPKLANDFNKQGYTHFIKKREIAYDLKFYPTHRHIRFKDILYPMSDIQKILDNRIEIEPLNSEKLQLSNAYLQSKLQKLTAENAELQKQLAKQADKSYTPAEPIEGKEISGKSQEAISRLVYVLLDLAKFDVTAHSGNDNLAIESHSQKLLNKPLTKPFIAEWLKYAITAKEKHAKQPKK